MQMARLIIRALLADTTRAEVSNWILAAEQDDLGEDKLLELTRAEQEKWQSLDEDRHDFLQKEARRLHVNSGHRPTRVLVSALRRRGAPIEAIAAMKQLRCSACHENQAPQPRPILSMDV